MPKKQTSEAERLAVALHVCKLVVWSVRNGKTATADQRKRVQEEIQLWAGGALTSEQIDALTSANPPAPSSLTESIREAKANEKRVNRAITCVRTLEYAYAMGAARGAEMDWSDVDDAREHARAVLGKDECAQIQRDADGMMGADDIPTP